MLKKILNKLSANNLHMQEVLRGASAALVIRILGTVLGFVVSILIARWLGVEGTGIYFLAISVVTILASLGRIGFDNTVVRYVAYHATHLEWADVRYVYRVAVSTVSVVSLILAAGMFIGAGWVAKDIFDKPFMEVPFRIAAVAILPLAIGMIHAEGLRGIKKIPASQWIKTVMVSLGTLLLLYPMIEMWGESGAVASYSLSVTVMSLVAWMMWKASLRTHSEAKERTVTRKKIFESSWPLFGVALTGMVMQQGALIMLGLWGTAQDVGLFGIANRVSSLLVFPLMAMISILAPKYSAMWRNNDLEGLEKVSRDSARLLLWIALPVSVIVGLCSSWILGIFGPGFAAGAAILSILLIGVVVNASTGAVAELLMMTGHEKDCRSLNILGAIIVVLLGVLLIPPFGAVGAAVAMALGVGVKNASMVYMAKKRLGFLPVRVI